MTNIAPILRVSGRVRRVTPRSVPESPAQPERRDESGTVTHYARDARPGYDVHDVVIDTDPGGLVKVVFRDQAVEDGGGWLPVEGESVDVPVRGFDDWQGRPGNRYRVAGYSFAGSVYAAETKARTGAGDKARALAPTG